MSSIYYPGNANGVLLLHSLTHTPDVVFYLANRLKKAGWTVYAPCLSGHDQERMLSLLKSSVADWTADVQEAVQFLREEGCQEIAVMGQSLGGLLTLQLLLDQPDIACGGILSAPAFKKWGTTAIYEEVAKRVATNDQVGLVPNLAKEQQAAKKKLDRILIDLEALIDTMIPNYEKIPQPIFVGQGTMDDMVEVANAETLAATVEQSRLALYEEAGHILTTSAVNRQLADDLIAFLREQGWE